MILGTDGMCESVDVAGELRIDGVSSVHSSTAHVKTRFVILGFAHNNR